MATIARDKFTTGIILLTLLAIFFLIPEWQAAVMFSMWCVVVLFCLCNIKQRVLLLLFDITLFTFLMTRLLLPRVFSTGYIADDIDGTIRMFDPDTLRFVYTTLVLSIFGSYLGFTMIKENGDEALETYENNTPYVLMVRRVSKIMAYGCSLFYAALLLEKAMYVFMYGYFEMYAEFDSSLPGVIHKLASLYIPVFTLFLATLPSRQEARPAVILYLCVSLVSLLTGSRTAFMLALVFILFYYILRNLISPDEPWLTRKAGIAIGIMLPFLLGAMFVIGFIRGEKEMEDSGFFDMFVNFFYQQGTSAKVIGLTYQLQDILGDRIFSFGQIIDNFKKNIIFQIMGTAVEYRSQTEEMALYGHSLANTLSYYTMYKSFLSGVGLGTSYIAEVWHDFGYAGLVLWNMMYGMIFAKTYQWIRKGLWPCLCGLIMIPEIIYAPRGYATAFINPFFSVTIMLTFLFIHIVAKHAAKQES